MLASLRDRAAQNATQSAVTAGARQCLDVEPLYSPEKFHEDWPSAPIEEDWHPEAGGEYLGTCKWVLEQAAARINQVFETELNELAVERAPQPVIRELGLLVKLTFARVKEAPGAWDMLDLRDKSAFIKGLRAMTAKRHSAATSRTKTDAKSYAAALEGLESIGNDDALTAALGGMDFDIDMGNL